MIPNKPLSLNSILLPRNIKVEMPFQNPDILNAEIIIGITIKNKCFSIKRALKSALKQNFYNIKWGIIILDDQSTDNWKSEIHDLIDNPHIMILSANCGSPARARNAILDFVDKYMPETKWVARLDADDKITTCKSVFSACKKGDMQYSYFILGSNRLVKNNVIQDSINYANPEILLNPVLFVQYLVSIANGNEPHEIPSCNLVLRTKTGFRYPNISSAEDHWLVVQLLLFHTNKVAILIDPIFSDYTLDGNATLSNKQTQNWKKTRSNLAHYAQNCLNILQYNWSVLGYGMEGVVIKNDQKIRKYFTRIIEDSHIEFLSTKFNQFIPHFPSLNWFKHLDTWVYEYNFFNSSPMPVTVNIQQVENFLLTCLTFSIVPTNIKRSNFRLTENQELFFVDIGNDIHKFHIDFFMDASARLYSQCILGWGDEELLRRISLKKEEDALSEIPGFLEFYSSLMEKNLKNIILPFILKNSLLNFNIQKNVSLMIKTCAMDADILDNQCRHIVSQLSYPKKFFEIILLIDCYQGPYLREYHLPDDDLMYQVARKLLYDKVITKILVAPSDSDSIRKTYNKWFAIDYIDETHTIIKAPLFSQIWGFSQVSTRYLLQCDVDIFIGRRDFNHDFLLEMLNAIQQENVLSVGFNIPRSCSSEKKAYHAIEGGYVPEIRCGLLDLNRIEAILPIYNPNNSNYFSLMWHRAIELHQKEFGFQSLRGGDQRSFYIHPQNSQKNDLLYLEIIRDQIAQGIIPECQNEKWDLQFEKESWQYQARTEDIVVLLKGKNTPKYKLNRCFASLLAQTEQNFGLIVIDDGSPVNETWDYPCLLDLLFKRTSLIRRTNNVGRIPNLKYAINEICKNKNSLIVILDLDDALINPNTMLLLSEYQNKGHDFIQMGMYRPDKPLKSYQSAYQDIRKNYGNNVWTHLRAFTKSLFEKIPDEYLKINDKWIEECTDYATMLPMAELAKNPVFIPEYAYYHERSEPYSKEKRTRLDKVILEILSKVSLKND